MDNHQSELAFQLHHDKNLIAIDCPNHLTKYVSSQHISKCQANSEEKTILIYLTLNHIIKSQTRTRITIHKVKVATETADLVPFPNPDNSLFKELINSIVKKDVWK